MSKHLYPTGHCFDDALDFIERLAKTGALLSTWPASYCVVVHGICHIPAGLGLRPEDVGGKPFAHAWVQLGSLVVQAGLLKRTDDPAKDRIYYGLQWEEFADLLKPSKVWRYSMQEVWQENERTMSYGPWVPELQVLLR